MAITPASVLADAFPERTADALGQVLEVDRQIRKLTAQKSLALIAAHDEMVSSVRFDNRMLAARSFRAQIAALLGITEKTAENQIGYARVLQSSFPRTLEALSAGDISWQHVTVIVDELAGMEERARGILEEKALAEAPNVTANKLGRVVRLARETLNPETIPERHEAARRNRGVQLLDDRDGMGGLYVSLPSAHAHAIFDRLTTGAKGIDGPLESRTLDQRRADIFAHVMLAEVDGEHFGIVPDEEDDESFVKWFRGITATVVVSVPVLTLLGQSEEPATLDGWAPIDPDTARILAAGATSFIRILTHPETGAVLSVGRKRYKVPKDLRTWLQIRDLSCRFPGCEIAAKRTDIDHTHDWRYGGETSAVNLGCMCRGHHALKTDGLWTVVQQPGGVMTFTDPSGRSYTTRPHRPMAA